MAENVLFYLDLKYSDFENRIDFLNITLKTLLINSLKAFKIVIFISQYFEICLSEYFDVFIL